MYQNTEMYKVASESEKVKSDVRCVDCLKIHLTPRQAPISANHTDWPAFSRAGSVSSTHGSEEEHTEFKTAFDTFLLYFAKSIMKQKIGANGNSRKRRKRKREEGRNTSKEVMSQEPITRNTSEEAVAVEPVTSNTSEKAVSQEPVNALLKSVEPVTRTKFNKQNTLDMIEKREDNNLWNENYFYSDI